MTGEWIRFGFCALFLLIGAAAAVIATIGVYRFRDEMCRMHAAAILDTLALSSLVIGALIAFGWSVEGFKGVAVIFFLWITSPANSHLLSRLEFLTTPERRSAAPGVSLPEEESGSDDE